MLTIEIKVNQRIVETVEVVQIQMREFTHVATDEEYNEYRKPDGMRYYRVNGVWTIQARLGDGHRVLARKAMNAIKELQP